MNYVNWCYVYSHLTRVTHICFSKLTTICSDNCFRLDGAIWTIIWTNAGMLLIGPLGTNFSEIFIHFHSRKCFYKCSLRNGGHFCVGLNVLRPLERSHNIPGKVCFRYIFFEQQLPCCYDNVSYLKPLSWTKSESLMIILTIYCY